MLAKVEIESEPSAGQASPVPSNRVTSGKAALAWRLDPRTKLAMLVITCVAASYCRDMFWGSALFMCVVAASVVMGRPRLAAKVSVIYVFVLGLILAITAFSPAVGARFGIVFQPFRSALAPLLMGALFITTTKTGDLVAGLYTMRFPQALVIPLAVGIRFFPTLGEEFRFILDAARLQGLRLSLIGLLAHPVMLFEALFIPIMMRSAKIAEELAAAATARGIERPGKRSSFNLLVIAPRDTISFCLYFLACILLVAAWHLVRGGVAL